MAQDGNLEHVTRVRHQRPLSGFFVTGAFLLVLAPALASAQSTAPTLTERQIAGWVFTPSIGFGGSWDDNVLLANPGGDPLGDYGTPIIPSASLDYRGKLTRFSSAYDGSFLRYRTLTALNSSQQGFRASLQQRINPRVTLFADENFTQAPTTDALRVAGLPFYRIGSRTNATGGGFDAGLAKHTLLRGQYTYRIVDFDAAPAAAPPLPGGHAHEMLVALTQALSARLTVGGQYELHRASITNQLNPSQVHTGSVTADYRVTPTLTVSGLLGISRLGGLESVIIPAGVSADLAAQAPSASRTGPAVRAAISQRTEHATFSAAYERSFVPSFGFGGTFQNQQWVANAHVPFARNRAFADSGITWSKNAPIDAFQPDLRSLTFSENVGYHVARWLRIEGYYERAQQDTQRAGGNLRRNQLGFRVVAVKPIKVG